MVPILMTIDGENLQELVNQAYDDDTEELLMNKLFEDFAPCFFVFFVFFVFTVLQLSKFKIFRCFQF